MKIKNLFAIAALFLSSSMAFAQGESATTKFRYTYDADGNATILGFVAGYAVADQSTVTIDPTVLSTDGKKTYKVTAIAADAFRDNANINEVVIASGDITAISTSFAGCKNLTKIDLTAAVKVETIAEGAFAGTKLAKLDLSKTKVATIPAMFGTSYYTVKAKDAVLWTDADAADIATHNGGLTGVVSAAGAVADAQAKAYNATLAGAAKAGDKITSAEFVTAYNATLGLLEGGIELTAAQATAVNTASAADDEWTNTAYNADDVLKKADADKYNATIATIKVGDDFDDTTAAAYNATLTGAIVATTWEFVLTEAETEAPAEKKIWTETYNRAVVEGYAYVGGVKEAAVKAVDPIAYATLTEVTLPETWTSISNYAFQNCTGLATITLTAAKAGITAQAIGTGAFLGTALTALDFTGTKVSGVLNANLLVDGVNVKKNTSLKTVTLTKDITGLNANFANCTALTAIDLTNIAYANINVSEFAGSGLTAITIPATYTAIPNGMFQDCTALATVTWAKPAEGEDWTFTEIGANAFANTALTDFTVPNVLDYKTPNGVAANAFADCTKLKTFTYKPNITTGTVQIVVNNNAFLGCEDGILFYTVKEYAEAAAPGANKVAPTHATFSYDASPASDPSEAKELTAKQFKQTGKTNMYFFKYQSMKQNIKIAKGTVKVYAAYNDDTDGTIIMQAFKPTGGYYHIAAGDNVLMISDTEKIPYETTAITNGTTFNGDGSINVAGKGSSWLTNAYGDGENKLKYISDEAGVKRSALEAAMPAGFNIYAWANTTAFTGWKKITSGSTFPQNTLYIFAKPAPEAEGVRVIWLDENGNIEDETTAIHAIESVEEAGNGASYNLAGQKVNASYKGVVIKDGKKYMQK